MDSFINRQLLNDFRIAFHREIWVPTVTVTVQNEAVVENRLPKVLITHLPSHLPLNTFISIFAKFYFLPSENENINET